MRRANGEGSYDFVEKNGKNGVWRWRGYYTDSTGEKKRKEIVAKSRKKLRAKVEEFQNELEAGSVCERVTVARWCNIWLEDSVKPSVKIRTYENYNCSIRNHIVPQFGKKYVDNLQPMEIQMYLNSLIANHAASTVITIRNHMIVMFNSAIENGYAKINAAKKTKPPRKVKNEVMPLTEEESNQLLEVAEKGEYIYHGVKQRWKENDGMSYLRQNYFGVVLVALTTGMRQGEVFGLKWSDIDFKAGSITVRHNMITSAKKR